MAEEAEMRGHTIWEMSRIHAADLLADAGPVRRRPRQRRVRRTVGIGLVRAGYRLLGSRAS